MFLVGCIHVGFLNMCHQVYLLVICLFVAPSHWFLDYLLELPCSIQIQNTLLSIAIITSKWKFFFVHTSSATLNNVVNLNTLKTEGSITHKEQLS